MARMTLRLPDSLHDVLASRAKDEGVSMNQFIVYALSQVAALDSVRLQRQEFEQMRNRMPEQEAEDQLHELLRLRESA